MKNLIQVAAVLPIAALSTSQSLAQAGAPLSADDLSKESENPVTRLITLPLRYEAEFFDRQWHVHLAWRHCQISETKR